MAVALRILRAVQERNARRRTPRIQSVTQTGTSSLVVTFDRDMDQTKDTATFRTFTAAEGAVEWTGGSWNSEREYESTTASVLGGYSGDSRAIYMDGDLRARGRFRVPDREACFFFQS